MPPIRTSASIPSMCMSMLRPAPPQPANSREYNEACIMRRTRHRRDNIFLHGKNSNDPMSQHGTHRSLQSPNPQGNEESV